MRIRFSSLEWVDLDTKAFAEKTKEVQQNFLN